MKKLMILGGSRYVLPVIRAAHDLGLYVITADYLPDNVAHKYSDEYCNVSVTDPEATLAAAKERKIDGVISFACDPGVVTAAYVAERMGLPFQVPYKSARILQDKGLFRAFLSENGFACPHARRYDDPGSPFQDLTYFTWPVIVKPTDSAGSKGVTRVDDPRDLPSAIEIAVSGARNGAYIIEDFLTFEGYHSSTDVFTVDGKVKFCSFSDQLFDPEADNPYTPARIIWPSSMKDVHQVELTSEIQRLLTLLHAKNGIYNIETCVGSDGKAYIMEVSPRGGGCKIAELQTLAYGIDFIGCEVRSALGMPLPEISQPPCKGHWCEMVIHAAPGEAGALRGIRIDRDVEEKYVKLVDSFAKPGDVVRPFTGANMSLGDMILCFDSREELDRVTGAARTWLHIDLC